MIKPASRIPTMVTTMVGVVAAELIVFLRVFGEAPASDPATLSQAWFSWAVAASGFITLVIGIGYGFIKKQRYENLKNDRNEWKGLAESREEKVKDLKLELSDQKIRLELKAANIELTSKDKDERLERLEVNNKAVVSQNLQMKAILRQLRISGKWEGDEENLHRTQ